jgi:hypothetical protein
MILNLYLLYDFNAVSVAFEVLFSAKMQSLHNSGQQYCSLVVRSICFFTLSGLRLFTLDSLTESSK